MTHEAQGRVEERSELRAVRQWLGLALAVLLLAGAFALLLVGARMPPLDRWVTDPAFFRRVLVVHVNLALVCWFYAFIAGLLALLPARAAPWTRWGAPVSALGVVVLGVAAGAPGAEPVLANYVPMIDHPLFVVGHLLFGGGVLLSFSDGRLWSTRAPWYSLDPAAIPGLRATALALVLAALTFLSSWLEGPVGVSTEVYWELVNWGGGHVLQLASECAMVAVWFALLGSALGRSPVSRPVATALFGALLLPWMFAPLLALGGTQSATYHGGFTSLMRWGIWPAVSVAMVLCIRALWVARREGRLPARALGDVRIAGVLASMSLALLGFVLGALIRGSNTIIPAHYHAAIGAVTVAFMAMTWPVLERVGYAIPTPRLRRLAALQPVLFGSGQLVFACGFALAGAHGMGRKVYGAEQAARTLGETVGLGIMGVGGLVAVAGGLLFLRLLVASLRHSTALKTPEVPCPLPNLSIPSNG